MKIMTRTLVILSLPALMFATGSSYAAAQLQTVDSVVQASGKSALRLHFDSSVGVPKSFTMKQPATIVMDFPGATSGMKSRKQAINSNNIKHVKFARGNNKLRVMVSLDKLTKYTTSMQGNDVVLSFHDAANHAQAKRPQVVAKVAKPATKKTVLKNNASNKKVVRKAAPRAPAIPEIRDQNLRPGPVVKRKSVKHQAVASNYRTRPVQVKTNRAAPQRVAHRPSQHKAAAHHGGRVLGPVDFQRIESGGGRAVIQLPHPATVVESRKLGNTVVLLLKNVTSRQPHRRINVLDFATPASYLDISRQGADVQIKILANKAFDFDTTRNGRSFVVNMNPVKRIATHSPLKKKLKKYTGKTLSLNFQDIEVRSVLQLLADFTDKNIVVSDTVKGNITLRLKNVPWDQALDIVLESKGLAMRSNGNVIWVAPASELEAKEQRELQAFKRKQALEPLVTEYIAVNYAKSEDMASLVQAAGGREEGSLLSKRGSISVDKRTNTLLVQDTVSRVNQIRAMVKNLDVPVRQVSVESRIVIANDNFGKNLGARFGVSAFKGDAAISGGSTAASAIAQDLAGGGGVGVPGLNDSLNVNLPIAGAAGTFGFAVLAKDFLLDLELSALQAESKGEIISTPRVVTADKKKALIEQGVEIPYLTAASSGATTVSFKKAVLSLEVTPQVTPDEHVIMDLKVNSDSVGQIFAGVPSINTREVNTQVLVANGQTVVLGGVHEEVNSKDVEKVPVLGDIPMLGRIFQRKQTADDKRELLIFVTPKIMK